MWSCETLRMELCFHFFCCFCLFIFLAGGSVFFMTSTCRAKWFILLGAGQVTWRECCFHCKLCCTSYLTIFVKWKNIHWIRFYDIFTWKWYGQKKNSWSKGCKAKAWKVDGRFYVLKNSLGKAVPTFCTPIQVSPLTVTVPHIERTFKKFFCACGGGPSGKPLSCSHVLWESTCEARLCFHLIALRNAHLRLQLLSD